MKNNNENNNEKEERIKRLVDKILQESEDKRIYDERFKNEAGVLLFKKAEEIIDDYELTDDEKEIRLKESLDHIIEQIDPLREDEI